MIPLVIYKNLSNRRYNYFRSNPTFFSKRWPTLNPHMSDPGRFTCLSFKILTQFMYMPNFNQIQPFRSYWFISKMFLIYFTEQCDNVRPSGCLNKSFVQRTRSNFNNILMKFGRNLYFGPRMKSIESFNKFNKSINKFIISCDSENILKDLL